MLFGGRFFVVLAQTQIRGIERERQQEQERIEEDPRDHARSLPERLTMISAVAPQIMWAPNGIVWNSRITPWRSTLMGLRFFGSQRYSSGTSNTSATSCALTLSVKPSRTKPTTGRIMNPEFTV